MTTLIMLCGQGSSGKSTFAKILESKFQHTANVHISAVDDFVEKGRYSDNPQKFYKNFLSDIQLHLNEQCDIIIADFSFDSRESRKHFLQQLELNEKIDFIAIRTSPPLENIKKWHAERRKKELSIEEEQNIERVYNGFEEFNANEFQSYNFNSIHLYSIDTSKIPMEEMKNDE